MPQTNTQTTLNGLYKTVYAKDGPFKLISDMAIVQQLAPFSEAQRIGKSFNFPIAVASAQGFTYAAADTTPTINTEVATQLQEVSVVGSQIIGQATISYEAAARAEASQAAFKSSVGYVIMDLLDSHSRKLEMDLIYGQSGIGDVASLAAQVITLTSASFAEGLLIGQENMAIDVYTAGGTLRVANLVISGVDTVANTLTVIGTTTGILATDVIYINGAFGKQMAGLKRILTNSAVLFGVDAALYSLWKASQFAVGGTTLTMGKVLSGTSLAMSRGSFFGEGVLLVNPKSWNDLNNDQAALRNYTDQKSDAVNGFASIDYRGVSGKISVVAHPMIKRGEAMFFPKKDVLKRVGACDITTQVPGRSEELFFNHPTLAAIALRSFSNQAIVAVKPAQCVLFTGII